MFGYLRALIWKKIIRSGGFTRLFGKIAVDLGYFSSGGAMGLDHSEIILATPHLKDNILAKSNVLGFGCGGTLSFIVNQPLQGS